MAKIIHGDKLILLILIGLFFSIPTYLHATSKASKNDGALGHRSSAISNCEVEGSFEGLNSLPFTDAKGELKSNEFRMFWKVRVNSVHPNGIGECPALGLFSLSVREGRMIHLKNGEWATRYPPDLSHPAIGALVVLKIQKIMRKEPLKATTETEWIVTNWEEGYAVKN